MRKIFILVILLSAILNDSFAQALKRIYKAKVANLNELAFEDEKNPHKSKGFKMDNEEKIERLDWEKALQDQPIPPGAKIFRQPKIDIPTSPNGIETSPDTNITFVGGIDEGHAIPPDGGGAVGPNHVVTTLNENTCIYTKTGTLVKKLTTNAFYAPVQLGGGVSDPHIKWDHFANRWIATSIDITNEKTNLVLFAISKTTDPTGDWNFYAIDVDPENAAFFFDYPLLGFNEKWVVCSGNIFNMGNGAFYGTWLYIFDKTAMLNGQDVILNQNAQIIASNDNGGTAGLAANGLPVIPMQSQGANAPMYILQNWSGSLSTVRLTTLTGNLPNVKWNIDNAIFYQGGTAWKNNWSTGSTANSMPQKGEARKIAQNDARFNNAFLVNGSIWGAHTVFLGSGGTEHTAIQWWQIDPNKGIIQRSRIDDPTGKRHRCFPTIAVNKNEDVLIGYCVGQNTIYPSGAYTFRNVNTPSNQMDNEVIFKDGLGTYYKDEGSGRCRWGDYAPGAVDPVDGSLWTMNHFAAARSGNGDDGSKWGTWWAQIIPPSIAAVTNDAQLYSVGTPLSGVYYCNNTFAPKVTIRNGSSNALTSAKVNYSIDGGPVVSVNFSGNLGQYKTADVSFPTASSLSPGNHVFVAYTTLPNNGSDDRLYNDTITVPFTVSNAVNLPLVQAFTGVTFPPVNWTRINPDNSFTWQRNTIGRTGAGSAYINCWDYGDNNSGQSVNAFQRDELRTPILNLPPNSDSIFLSFAHSYAAVTGFLNPNNPDGLEVKVSADCGYTWNTVFSKFGEDLNSHESVTAQWAPTGAADWKLNNIDLSSFSSASQLIVKFESVNGYGNDIFIDDINIFTKNASQRDLTITNIVSPLLLECSGTITPVISVRQLGKTTITTAKVNYQIDGGNVNTFDWTGSLSYGKSTNITLPILTLSPGQHDFKVWTSLPNSLADENTINDTMSRKGIAIFSTTNAPLKEGFESGTFPPTGWGISNPDFITTWARTVKASKSGSGAAFMNNYSYSQKKQPDMLISPIVLPESNIDSVLLHFQLSATTYNYPGSTSIPLDTLEILVTSDCGKTFTSVYKKWGNQLQTINDPNFSYGSEYYPLSKSQWREEIVDLTPLLSKIGKGFQVAFRNVNNTQNNIFVDDINLFTKQLPTKLKAQGYLISPNPFEKSFTIWHLKQPTDLRSIGLYNSVGQLLQSWEYDGNASSNINMDMSKYATGTYIVQLKYSNRTVTERVIKVK